MSVRKFSAEFVEEKATFSQFVLVIISLIFSKFLFNNSDAIVVNLKKKKKQ